MTTSLVLFYGALDPVSCSILFLVWYTTELKVAPEDLTAGHYGWRRLALAIFISTVGPNAFYWMETVSRFGWTGVWLGSFSYCLPSVTLALLANSKLFSSCLCITWVSVARRSFSRLIVAVLTVYAFLWAGLFLCSTWFQFQELHRSFLVPFAPGKGEYLLFRSVNGFLLGLSFFFGGGQIGCINQCIGLAGVLFLVLPAFLAASTQLKSLHQQSSAGIAHQPINHYYLTYMIVVRLVRQIAQPYSWALISRRKNLGQIRVGLILGGLLSWTFCFLLGRTCLFLHSAVGQRLVTPVVDEALPVWHQIQAVPGFEPQTSWLNAAAIGIQAYSVAYWTSMLYGIQALITDFVVHESRSPVTNYWELDKVRQYLVYASRLLTMAMIWLLTGAAFMTNKDPTILYRPFTLLGTMLMVPLGLSFFLPVSDLNLSATLAVGVGWVFVWGFLQNVGPSVWTTDATQQLLDSDGHDVLGVVSTAGVTQCRFRLPVSGEPPTRACPQTPIVVTRISPVLMAPLPT
eukprot:Gregarina_sp_Pseudo_9__995@NODE_163_length_3904_cov_44_414230_g150_i0_p1_GENE_NODE_163_length_3904_cov_44_414230_g150_i0NODE_163_length_3904_cov_44_414230_g150_i0_p1_ORF_typecomplete_len516_score49_87_NODE_163_length_3904_cov_44_414230_g150_i0831630